MPRDAVVEGRPRFRIEDDTWCLIIAVLQVLGGLYGIALTVYYHGGEPPSLNLSLLMAPFVWGIFGGVLLWRGMRRGLIHSIAVQAMQIPRFAIPLVGYEVYIGAKLQVGWMGGVHILEVYPGSSVSYFFNAETCAPELGVNLIALAAFLYLRKVKARVAEADAESGSPQPPID